MLPARAARDAPLEVQATSYLALSARIVSLSIKDCSMECLPEKGIKKKAIRSFCKWLLDFWGQKFYHFALVSTTRPAMCRRLRSSPLMTISL